MNVSQVSPIGEKMVDTDITTHTSMRYKKSPVQPKKNHSMHRKIMTQIAASLELMSETLPDQKEICATLKKSKVTTTLQDANLMHFSECLALIPEMIAHHESQDVTLGSLAIVSDKIVFDTKLPALACERTNDLQETVNICAYTHERKKDGGERAQDQDLSYFGTMFVHATDAAKPKRLENSDVNINPILSMPKKDVSHADRRRWCKCKHLQDMDSVGINVGDVHHTMARHLTHGIIECRSSCQEHVITSFFFPNRF